jgi:hypothetical protein
MPRVLILAAKCEPYDITDRETGKRQQGMSGMVWGCYQGSHGGQGVVGLETFAVKTDPAVATDIKRTLATAKRPILATMDFDVKGNGNFAKRIATDWSPDTELDPAKHTITTDGIVTSQAAPAATPARTHQPLAR